ncbi:hypothetical protein [Olivibacter sitiensis]|uniref:hypothetical protein n=1 Tax=Olivibacter sitiensis TaxID=376470 RepID=UPI0004194AB3|nr:hypothetical protein [Olivibacter sitiensis]
MAAPKRDDALWKSILETVFREFLLFFYPNAGEIFDFSKGFVYLDKEFDTLFPPEEGNNKGVRFVDKLVKVYLRDGTEQFILAHIEVQSQKGKNDLEERMFRYYYLVRDKYKVPITAIAILADGNRSYHPTEHVEGFLNTQLIYRFDTYKIIGQDEAALRANPNPFAVCVLTALLALKRRGADDNELKAMKHDLYDQMMRRKMDREKRHALYAFLTYFVRFEKKEMFAIFETEIKEKLGKEDPMGITEYLLDRAKKEGSEKERAKAEAEKRNIVANLIQQLGLDDEAAAGIAEVSIDFVQKVRSDLDKKK